MGAAVLSLVLVLGAQVGTATIAATATTATATMERDSLDALLEDLGEGPLSHADLEMLARLRAATGTVARTASVAWAAPGPLVHPVYRTGVRARRETVARSTREALDALVVPAVSFRMSRRRVLYEGLLLAPMAEGVLDASVRMFDRVEVTPSASVRDQAAGAAGTIALYGAEPEVGIHPEGAIEARSADRSSDVFVAVGGGVGSARGRVAVGYDDMRALRTPDGSDPTNSEQRWLASVRGVLFDGDPVRVTVGGDLDRALNTRAPNMPGVARLDQRALGFLRVELGSATWGARLTGGYQGLRQHQELDPLVRFDVSADLYQAQLALYGAPYDWLRLEAGGDVAIGSGRAPDEVRRRELEGYVMGTLLFDRLEAQLGLRIAQQHSEEGTLGTDALRPLPQLDLHLPIAGPVGVRASFAMGMTLPGRGLFAPMGRFLKPETTVTVEAGPTLRADGYWADLTAFAAWIHQPLEPMPDPLPITDTPALVRALGVDLDGAAGLIRNLDLAFTTSLAEVVDRRTGAATYALPVLSGLVALRYRFGFRNAHLEVHARAATGPLTLIGDAPIEPWMLGGQRPKAFLRAGLLGGLDLGYGFTLDLAVENAIDRRYRLQTRDEPGGGIDVRAALTWKLY